MARIGILGDLHLRASKPINRLDTNYQEKQFTKLNQAFDSFAEEGCTCVVQAGDLFNNYGNDPYSITYETIAFLMLRKIPIYGVFGQHDIKFHNTEVTDIPIQILNKTNLFNRLTDEPTLVGVNEDVALYGASWDEDIPDIIYNKKTNILVMHRMVIKGKKLWPGQTDYLQARRLNKLGFDLIVSGDNHNAFTSGKVVNCGSLMRMTIAQMDHEPIYAIYDTKTDKIKTYKYDIDPAKSVLNEEKVREKQASDRYKDDFRASLNSDFEGELNYRENVNKVIKKRKRVRKRTKDIIEESLDE